MFEGYCIHCRKKQVIKDGIVTITSRGKSIIKGVCPVCDTRVTRFLTTSELRTIKGDKL